MAALKRLRLRGPACATQQDPGEAGRENPVLSEMVFYSEGPLFSKILSRRARQHVLV